MAEQLDQRVALEVLPVQLRVRYGIERGLGAGTFGPSWLLRERETETLVVAKRMVPGVVAGGRTVAMLRQTSAIALDAPGAAQVSDVIEEGGAVWLVRQYLPGESFAEALSVLGRFTDRQARSLIGGACRGLLAGTEQVLLHGHLCPENLLILGGGAVYVSDHGLAPAGVRREEPMSFAYQAPELFEGALPSLQADVYALGALLYTALCGRYPLALTDMPASDLAVVRAHHLLPPPAGVPLDRELGRIVWQALRPQPEERFASARELLAVLGAVRALQPGRGLRRLFHR